MNAKVLFLFLIIFMVSSGVVFADQFKTSLHSSAVFGAKPLKTEASASADLFTGAAVFTYPLQVPPGTNGLEPTIALAYNSHATKGLPTVVGAGWSLAQSYIQRDAEYTLDDISDDTFKLVLDGNEYDLIFVPEEERFHTEIESFLFIEKQEGGENEFGEYWIVKKKDGTAYRFGYTPDSEQVSNLHDHVWRWNLDQIEDTYNNHVYYSYEENQSLHDEGASYLSRIEYNNDRSRIIDFVYEEEQRPDKRTVYDNGNKQTIMHRLQEIQVSTADERVRTYSINYETISRLSAIHSITVIGKDGTSIFPPTTFSYLPEIEGWTSSLNWIAHEEAAFSDESTSEDEGVRIVDVNGDGRADLVERRDCRSSRCGRSSSMEGAWLSTDDGWSWAPEWLTPSTIPFVIRISVDRSLMNIDYGTRITDINNDGLVDLVLARDCGRDSFCRDTWLNTGHGWSSSSDWELPYYADETIELADVNGDGWTDVLLKKDCGGTDCEGAWLNDQQGHWVRSPEWILPYDAEFTDDDREQDRGTRLVDLNNDGLVDIIKKQDCGSDYCNRAWLNTGHGWSYSGEWEVPPGAIFSERSSGEDKGTRIADVNGDGLPDLLRKVDCGSADCNRVWLNTGDGWFQSSEWVIPYSASFVDGGENEGTRLGDMTGDGLVDIIKQLDCGSSSCNGAWINNGHSPFLLKEINNSLGGVTTIDYVPSTTFENTGEDGINDLPFAIPVVRNITTWNGMDRDHRVESSIWYRYSGGLYDFIDKEFRGFLLVQEGRPDGSLVRHWFHQDKARKGKEYAVEIFDEGEHKIKDELKVYISTEQDSYFIVSLDSLIENFYYGEDEPTRTLQTDYEYDQYGNTERIVHHGDLALEMDEKEQMAEYVYNTDEWIVDKPKKEYLLDHAGEKGRETKYSYDEQAYGFSPIKGGITKITRWNNDGPDIEEDMTYDDYGNIATVENGRGYSTTYKYDSTGTLVREIENALGQVASYDYDLGTGNLLSEIDPNGFATEYKYDTLRRLWKVIKPYDSEEYPTIEYNYQMRGSAPVRIMTLTREQSGADPVYETASFYDGFGRPIQIRKEAENTQSRVTNYFYDTLGRLERKANPVIEQYSPKYVRPRSALNWTTFRYNQLGELIQQENPDGTSKNIVYTGSIIQLYDEDNNKIEYTIDGFDRVVGVREFNNGEEYTTTYEYDAQDNINIIEDHGGNTIRYAYDSLGRKRLMTDHDLGVWSYEYDEADNLERQEDANGNIVDLTYDEINRIETKESGDARIEYDYDFDKIGTLSTVIMDDLTTYYHYDDRLRLSNETSIFDDGIRITTIYDYDAMDRVTRITNPQESTRYSYNEAGLLSGINGVLQHKEYDAAEFTSKRGYANGMSTMIKRDPLMFRISKIRTLGKQDVSYYYDNTGNVLATRDRITGILRNMTYDDIGRMGTASARSAEENIYSYDYDYDYSGNLVQVTSPDYSISYAYDEGTSPLHAPFLSIVD